MLRVAALSRAVGSAAAIAEIVEGRRIMAEQATRGELARLRGEVAALHRRHAALAAELALLRGASAPDRERHARAGGMRRIPATLAAALLVALVPLSVLATNPFADLNPGSVHNANIDAIYEAGVTTGCVPDAEYCPNATVTREEMASFLARTAGLGGNPPVANANLLDGLHATDLVRVNGAETTGTDLTGSFTTTAQVTLTAPVAGFVLVTATIRSSSISGTCPCEASHHLTRLDNPAISSLTYRTRHEEIDSSASVELTAVFPVTAGTFTFAVRSILSDAGAEITIDAGITALFVPFGPTGGGTLDAP